MTDPTPDIDGYPDHRAAVPDEHTALRLLRRLCDPENAEIEIHTWEDLTWAFIDADISLNAAELDLLHRLTQQENPT